MAVKIYCCLVGVKLGTWELREDWHGNTPFLDFGGDARWMNDPATAKANENEYWKYIEILWDDELNMEVVK